MAFGIIELSIVYNGKPLQAMSAGLALFLTVEDQHMIKHKVGFLKMAKI